MTDREKELVAALKELSIAIQRQLAGTGRGVEPSPRVQEALDAAASLIAKTPAP